MDRVNYKGWRDCVRLFNGEMDLVVTTAVGPRIIRFGFRNDHNEFKEFEDTLGLAGGDEWRIYGGHRLWHAPEIMPRTYQPDNVPVAVEEYGDFVRIVQPTEARTGIQKELDLRVDSHSARAHVTHRVRNTNLWAVELAPWALSVMAPGGVAIIPLPERLPHSPTNLLPQSTVVLWSYTDMTDPRWTWGSHTLMLTQHPGAATPQKAGAWVPDGWAAYARAGHLFVVRFTPIPGAAYPDRGCSFETYTDGDMLELETLGPLSSIEPGECVEHVEEWYLFRGLPTIANERDVDEHVLPRVSTTRG